MLRHMRHVYAVYREKSFSKAAEKLFISQPALSNIIKRVEEEIGLSLFDRNSIPIQLTPAGAFYIQSIEKIMEIQQEMELRFVAMLGESKGAASIGSATFFCAHVLPEIIQNFHEEYPSYNVNLLEGNVEELSKCLHTGVIDLCLDTESLDPQIFASHIWQVEHIVLAVPAHFMVNGALEDYRMTFEDVYRGRFLSPNQPAVSVRHFSEEPFLLLKKGNDMYRRALEICKNAGFVPNAVMSLDQLLTSYYVAAGGQGITFVRTSIAHYVEPTDKLYFYKIDDENARRNIMLYYKKAVPLSSAAQQFCEYLLSWGQQDRRLADRYSM